MKRILLFIGVAWWFLCTPLSLVQAQTVVPSDSVSLVALYNATNGPSWGVKWNFSKPVATWPGVLVSPSGRVVRLELNGVGLDGTLPAEMANLTSLRFLALVGNKLRGTLAFLPKLKNVEEVWLYANQLSGSIPDNINECTALKVLLLNSNQLEGVVPAGMCYITGLQKLDLRNNKLSGVLPIFWNLTPLLTHFEVANNQLKGPLPERLGGLPFLQRIDMSFNQFTGAVPSLWGNLPSLTFLNLSANKLSGNLPPTLSGLKNLKDLNISANQITGGFSANAGGWTNLERLYVNDNVISDTIPLGIGNLNKLQEAHMYNNRFKGLLPDTLSGLRSLKFLFLQNNSLAGFLPKTLGYMPELMVCDLSFNKLEYTLPYDIYRLSNLISLNISNNAIEGGIPERFYLLSKLQTFRAANNKLEGSLPANFSALKELLVLDLSNNEFVGPIPAEFGGLRKLTFLNLSRNRLTGRIPAGIMRMFDLNYLDLSFNGLDGNLPAGLENLKALGALILENNQLTGDFPSRLDSLKNLGALIIRDNRFSGFPVTLRSDSKLRFLAMENNNFTFEDIEPLMPLTTRADIVFSYTPQKDVPLEKPCMLKVNVGGSANNYSWVVNGDTIRTETQPMYKAYTPGAFHCIIKSDIVTKLILRSELVNLNADEVLPRVVLGSDMVFCEPFSQVLDAGVGTSYKWSTGDTSRTITVKEAGRYFVNVRNKICEASDTIFVIFRGVMSNKISSDQRVCPGNSVNKLTGEVTLAKHKYLWESSEDQSSWTSVANTADYQPTSLAKTTYYRRTILTDSCGKFESNIVKVSVSNMELSVTTTMPSCKGDSDGQITINIKNGFAPYTVRWFSGDSIRTIKNLKAGVYSVTVMDSLSCQIIQNIELKEPDELSINPEIWPASCNSTDNNGAIIARVSGGNPPYSYTWSTGASTYYAFGLSPKERYSLTVTDSKGCSTSGEWTLERTEASDAGFFYDSDRICSFQANPRPRITGLEGGTFSEKNAALSINPQTGEIDLNGVKNGDYEILYTLDTCSTASFKLSIVSDCLEKIPNTITPNGDNYNDVWKVELLKQFPNAIVQIFDSNGKRIWESEKGYPEPWDARIDGHFLPAGTYYYLMEFNDPASRRTKHTGFISVL